MKKITINRSQWYNGTIVGKNQLGASLWNRKHQRGCCIGHFISQVDNIPIVKLTYLVSPLHAQCCGIRFNKAASSLFERGLPSKFFRWAAKINDRQGITEAIREEALKKVFLKEGYELEFTGKLL